MIVSGAFGDGPTLVAYPCAKLFGWARTSGRRRGQRTFDHMSKLPSGNRQQVPRSQPEEKPRGYKTLSRGGRDMRGDPLHGGLPPCFGQAEALRAKETAMPPSSGVTGRERRGIFGHPPSDSLDQMRQSLVLDGLRPGEPAFEPSPRSEHLWRVAGAVPESEQPGYIAVGKRLEILGKAPEVEEQCSPINCRVAHEPTIFPH